MKPQDFFYRHPVFRYEEFVSSLGQNEVRRMNTWNALLTHYKKTGRILQVRRGLYAVVPYGSDPEKFTVDSFLLASRMTEDSILAYHTALEFYERAYSVHERFLYLSEKDTRVFSFQSALYQSVRFPNRLSAQRQTHYGVINAERQGMEVRVTGLERAMVDVLDRPSLGGGWEEIWRSLESVEFYDLDRVVEYALILGNATTIAKTGFFLEQHREQFNVTDNHLHTLRTHVPKKPHYMIRANRQTGRFFDSWNLIVPEAIVDRTWEDLR